MAPPHAVTHQCSTLKTWTSQPAHITSQGPLPCPSRRSFLKGLLNKRPADRLGWPDLLEHPFVRETQEERLKREKALADAMELADSSRAWKVGAGPWRLGAVSEHSAASGADPQFMRQAVWLPAACGRMLRDCAASWLVRMHSQWTTVANCGQLKAGWSC